MKTVFSIIIGFVLIGAIAGYLFGKEGEKREQAAVVAASVFLWFLNLLPFIISVLIILAIVRSCS